MDIKEKYIDLDVLKALVTSVEKKLEDPNNVSIFKYKQNILKLFGRITSLSVMNWQVYWFYAEVVLNFALNDENNELSKESAEKYFVLLQKAFRNLYNKQNWEMTIETCKEILNFSTTILSSMLKKIARYLLNI